MPVLWLELSREWPTQVRKGVPEQLRDGRGFCSGNHLQPLTIWGFFGEEGMNVLQHCDVFA